MKILFSLVATSALAACAGGATPSPESAPKPQVEADGIARAAMGERIYVDGPYVTPLEVLEDSRCPMNARCVWAGRVRLSIRVDLGAGSQTREIATDEPIQVADGTLSLVEVQPDRVAGEGGPLPAPYRFGFTFAGGI